MGKEDIKKKQKEALGALWAAYGYVKADIARDLGCTRGTVGDYFRRGRISATAAIKIEKMQRAKDAGITKEMLRPDVKEWFGV